MPVLEAAPRYVVQHRLGSGGMGVVYLATLETPAGRRQVAVKRLLPGDALEESEARDRLVAEARLVFQLTHGNVCQVLDLAVGAEGTFVVMEYVRGLDLAALLRHLAREGRRLDVASAVYIAREIARALHYAHRSADENGVSLFLVHGDVTPKNILLSVEGEVKLADFGIARAFGVAAPGTGLRGGTPGYLAPEALASGADHRLDIFSLGATLHAALSGESPSASAAPGGGALRERRPEVSADLVDIVARATMPDPRARFLAASDLERALSRELASRWPDYTPSVLADTVAACAGRQTGAEPHALTMESLQSLTLTSLAGGPRTGEVVPPSVAASPGGRATRTVAPAPAPRRGRAAWVLATLVIAAAASAGAAWIVSSAAGPSRTPTPTPTPTPAPTPTPDVQASSPVVDPSSSPPPPPPTDAPRESGRPSARAGHGDRSRTPSGRRHEDPPERSAAPAAPAAAPGTVTVNSTPWGAVYIDGRRVAEETPLYRHRLPAGKHRIKVFFPDRGSYSREKTLTVEPGESVDVAFRAEDAPAR